MSANIQNFEDVTTTDKKRDGLEILEAELQPANPEKMASKFITP